MIRAVFLDYTGTAVREGGPEIQEAMERICRSSTLTSIEAFQAVWWPMIRSRESRSYAENFRCEEDIMHEAFLVLQETYQLKENLRELEELTMQWWRNAPFFDDTVPFFENCPWPVYMISNNAVRYVEYNLHQHGITPAGIVSGEMAHAYKPHREIFQKGLELAGYAPEEVVHIGDSYSSDVLGAISAGIGHTVLLDREGKQSAAAAPETVLASDLLTALEILKEIDRGK